MMNVRLAAAALPIIWRFWDFFGVYFSRTLPEVSGISAIPGIIFLTHPSNAVWVSSFPCFWVLFWVLRFLGRPLFSLRSFETAQFFWICELSSCMKPSLKEKLDFSFLQAWISIVGERFGHSVNFWGKRSWGYGMFSSRVSKRLVLLPCEL